MDTEYSDWQIGAHFFDKQSSSHWVLLRRIKESNGWQNFRLCVLGTLRKKRSYWIAWNPSEQRFAKGSEENHMNQYNVGLKQRLEEYLLKSTEALRDAAARDVRVSSASSALERLRSSNPFDRAPSTDSRMRYFFSTRKSPNQLPKPKS